VRRYSLMYLVFSTCVILANKHIITETDFKCPIAVSSLGSLFGWVVSVLAVGRCGLTVSKPEPKARLVSALDTRM
jgi:hypothetical protein